MIVSLCRKILCPKCWNQLVGNFDVYLHGKNQLHLKLLFWGIVKTLQTCYFENCGNAWPSPSKLHYQFVASFHAYLHAKNQLHHQLFLRYCKKEQTCYFGYFGHAWLHPPKMIVSTYRRLWCLFTCQKYTSLFTSFLRYYILKNPAIWLGDNILDLTREQGHCQIWDWWWNINNNISFHFRLFPRKSNDKVFQKIQKKTYFGAIWGHFLAKSGQKRVFLGKRAVSVLDIPIIYNHAKNQKKLMSHFWEKRRTDRQTDNGDSMGPSVRQGSNNILLRYQPTTVAEVEVYNVIKT